MKERGENEHQENTRHILQNKMKNKPGSLSMQETDYLMLQNISIQLDEIRDLLHQIIEGIQDPSTPEQEQITASAPRKNWVSRLLN